VKPDRPETPNLNAVGERWLRAVKRECLAQCVVPGEGQGMFSFSCSVSLWRTP
jgi:hypothetical protein